MYYNTTSGSEQIKIWDGAAWQTAVFDATGAVLSFNGRDGAVTLSATDINTALGFTAIEYSQAEKDKLAGIENGATADQTKADIDLLGVDSATVTGKTVGTNVPVGAVFTDTVYDGTAIRADVDANTLKRTYPATDETKLAGVEAGATGDQTDAEIKIAYENNTDTNAYTDVEKAQVAATEITTQLNARDTTNRLRDNHTGTQLANTISDLTARIKTDETTTSITLNVNSLDYVNEDGITSSIDLSKYLDDTTVTISGGVLNGTTGVCTFTRSDLTTFDVDLSALFDDTNAVLSVSGKSGVVTLNSLDVGLGNVDNTADIDKPVSAAVQTILDLKANKANPSFTGSITEEVVVATDSLDPANGTVQTRTLTANTTFADSLATGQFLTLVLVNGGFAVTWPTMTWWEDAAPTLGTTDKIFFEKIGTTLYGTHSGSLA